MNIHNCILSVTWSWKSCICCGGGGVILKNVCWVFKKYGSQEILTVLQEERRGAIMPRYQPRPAMAVAAVPVSVATIAPPVSSVAIMSPMAGPPIMRHTMHLGPPAAMLGGNMNMMRPPPVGLPPGKSTGDMIYHVMPCRREWRLSLTHSCKVGSWVIICYTKLRKLSAWHEYQIGMHIFRIYVKCIIWNVVDLL